MDIFFFEAFEEEQAALKKYNAGEFDAGYTWKTIQEYNTNEPPADIISVRTQSKIPAEWAGKLKAILTRSTGFDHLTAYRNENRCEKSQVRLFTALLQPCCSRTSSNLVDGTPA